MYESPVTLIGSPADAFHGFVQRCQVHPVAQITLDLATKIVPKDQVIWAVFPGRGRRFLDIFTAQSVIFLDVPGIALTPDVLENDELLRKHVVMSEAVAESHHGGPPVRSRQASAYATNRGGSISAAVGNVRNMYAKMKPGDLVLMGGKSLYGRIHAGEITKPFLADDIISDVYDGEDIPYRNVKWFNDLSQRRFLTERLSHLLSNRKAVISIDKVEFGDEVFTFVYGDFIFGDDSRYVFEGPKYQDFAPATVPGIQLLSYFVAATNAYEKGNLPQFKVLGISQAIDTFGGRENLHSFEIDFASPGKYVIHAKKAAKASVIALLVAATSDNISYAEAKGAALINSANHVVNAAVSCAVPIQEEYQHIMDAIGADHHNELCQLHEAAKRGVGLRVGVKVKKQ